MANKSASTRGLNLTLQKSEIPQPAYILFNIDRPSKTSFQIIDSGKLVIRHGDNLKVWTDSLGANSLDVTISYVIYTPVTTSTAPE